MRLIVVLVTASLLAGCGIAFPSASGVSATPPVSPGLGPPLGQADLKYRLIDRFGQPWFCDRDRYPLARNDEQTLALAALPQIQADHETYSAILRHQRLTADNLSDQDRLVVYQQWKQLVALSLVPRDGRQQFAMLFRAGDQDAVGSQVTGSIGSAGDIQVDSQKPAGRPVCPICLAAATRIATPDGPVVVTDLRPGAVVWTLDSSGRRIPRPVVRVASTPAPPHHQVVHLILSDGRAVLVSPGHPTTGGRMTGALRPGDSLDGAVVRSADRVSYVGSTFDLLPDGPTAAYWADGILLKSTITS